jgi:hypothetical protein
MELKKINCKTSETKYYGFDLIRYDDDTVIFYGNGVFNVFDISNPLKMKLKKTVELENYGANVCFYDNKIYLSSKYKIIVVDALSPEDLKEERLIKIESGIKNIAVASDKRIFAISTDGDIGEVDAEGTFIPLFSDIKLENDFCDIKVRENLLVVAEQDTGVLLFDIKPDGLTLLKHVKFGNAMTPVPVHFVLDNNFLFLMRLNDIVMVDIRVPEKAKRLKAIKCPTEVSENYPVKWENDYIVAGYFNNFELYLLDVNESGLKIKQKIKMPGRQYGHNVEIFRKDKYLLIHNSDDIFEVHEIIK